MRILIALALFIAAVAAVPTNPQRIVGGSLTTINNYPSMVALLVTNNWSTYWQSCGGSIINNRHVLTAAHCVVGDAPGTWRSRVGSSYANSGGVVHNTQSIIIHPNYNRFNQDNDVAILRLATNIALNNNARAGSFPGPNYNIGDNQVVWATGWGRLYSGGPLSEQLRHVQVWTINQNTCATRYREIGYAVTDNMLCAGWLDVGGRDACQGDSGGPLYHNSVIVGITSWGQGCALARYPGVNVRMPRVISWVQANV